MSTSQTPQQVLDLYVNIDLQEGEDRLTYIRPINTCTKYRNDFTSVLEKCSFPSCKAPAFCHYSLKPFCQRTRQELESNKLELLTSNRLCIGCLSMKVCCLVDVHPSEADKKRKFDAMTNSQDIQATKKYSVEAPETAYLYSYFSCLCKKDNILKNSSIEMIGSQDPEELEKDENERRIWSFKENPNDTKWLSEVFSADYIYNRECYDYFLNKIINLTGKKENLLKIYGTPGIGKSMFLNIVFHHIIESYRNSQNKDPVIIGYDVKKFEQKYNLEITLFKENDKVKFQILTVQPSDLENLIHYHIADTSNPKRAKFFSLYVASYKEGNKVKVIPGLVGFQEFMPLFSIDELGKISPPDWTEAQRKFRYSILGGCARNFLINTEQSTVKLDDFLQEAVDLFIPEKFRTLTLEDQTPNPFYPHFLSICLILRDVFVKKIDDKSEERVNFLTRTTVRFIPLEDSCIADWSTTVIKLIASHIKNHIDQKIWEQISDIISESAKGGLFEASIHPTLFKSRQGSNIFKYLDTNEKIQTKDVSFNISGLKYIWNPDGIAELEDNEYGLPLKQNFPAIDAIIQPNILIQITIAKKHPIKQHLLEQCRAQLRGERNTHMLIYIIPPDVISFEINNFSFKPPQTRSQTQDSIRNTNEDQHPISDIHTPNNNNEIPQLVGYINATTDCLKNLKITKLSIK